MRRENWREIQENRKWENRDGWRLFVIVDPYLRKQLKNAVDDGHFKFQQHTHK